MAIVGRRASKAIPHEIEYTPSNGNTRLQMFADVFQKLDVVGVFLLTATLSLTLIPLTLAGGESKKWQTAGIITPLVLGLLMIPVFAVWERTTAHPMMPKYLLREWGVWAALCVAIFMSFSWCTQSDFLYTVLTVGFDFNIADSTRIASVYSFCAIVGGLSLGLIIKKVRRLKPFIIGGISLWLIAYGLLFHYRGGTDTSAKAGVIAGQVLLGLTGGFFSYPNVAAAQALSKNEDIAVITSIMLTMNNVGVALGNAVSGAIWTQTLYNRLQRDLAPNFELAQQVYAAPLYVVPEYPVGTPERTAIIESYRYVQRLLMIAGMCLVIPMLAFAICLRDTRLPKPKKPQQ
ncbi:ferrioxamine B transporter [Fusarium falciforme]|nr:ferrioxamine B transporter [Fusarium falciforme]